MTLLVGWAGCDCKKGGLSPASIYFAADNRYSYMLGKAVSSSIDTGKKVFNSKSSPNIFTFCGEVGFGKKVICSLLSCFESVNFGGMTISDVESTALKTIRKIDKASKADCTIYHGTRLGKTFYVLKYCFYKGDRGVVSTPMQIPCHSDLIFVDGSGETDFQRQWENKYGKRNNNNNYRTSRAVYHCLQNTLSTSDNPTVGCIPQIVGLYRVHNGRQYGIINDGKRHVVTEAGVVTVTDEDVDKYSDIEWRNEQFELTDPYTKELRPDSQVQPSI